MCLVVNDDDVLWPCTRYNDDDEEEEAAQPAAPAKTIVARIPYVR